jgi:DNA-damage-inducible protein J
MDADLKKKAEDLFSDLGLNMTSALTMFLKQAVRTQGIPFEVTRQPNAQTLAAMKEAERIARDPAVRGYDDLDELLSDLKA